MPKGDRKYKEIIKLKEMLENNDEISIDFTFVKKWLPNP